MDFVIETARVLEEKTLDAFESSFAANHTEGVKMTDSFGKNPKATLKQANRAANTPKPEEEDRDRKRN